MYILKKGYSSHNHASLIENDPRHFHPFWNQRFFPLLFTPTQKMKILKKEKIFRDSWFLYQIPQGVIHKPRGYFRERKFGKWQYYKIEKGLISFNFPIRIGSKMSLNFPLGLWITRKVKVFGNHRNVTLLEYKICLLSLGDGLCSWIDFMDTHLWIQL